jgi:sec-independent protein translocase protein TatC
MSKKSAMNMTFFEHIEELRWHVFRSAVLILVLSVVLLFLKDFIFETLIFGPLNTDFFTYTLLCKIAPEFCVKEIPFELMNTELAGQFLIHLKTSFLLGFIFSIPYIFWELWKFVSPALYQSESAYAKKILGAGAVLFFIGVLFGYFLVTPLSILFFSTYSVSAKIVNRFSIDNYFSFLSSTVIWCGLTFEMPILVYFLSKIGLITPAFLVEYRKHLYIAILLIAAAITPSPDVLSQVMVAIPLFLLYEISIVVAQRVKSNLEKEAAEL